MHPATAFHESDLARLAAFVAARAFAVVIGVTNTGRAVAAHAPVLPSPGADPAAIRFHLASANPLTAALRESAYGLAVISGADAYVSPNWYGAPDQVPTWNYLTAEAEGAVRALSREETIDLLDALSARFEADLAPEPPWTRAKMDPARFAALVDHVSGFEMRLERFEGVRKLSQNKAPDQIRRVADHLAARPEPGASEIARLMREL